MCVCAVSYTHLDVYKRQVYVERYTIHQRADFIEEERRESRGGVREREEERGRERCD